MVVWENLWMILHLQNLQQAFHSKTSICRMLQATRTIVWERWECSTEARLIQDFQDTYTTFTWSFFASLQSSNSDSTLKLQQTNDSNFSSASEPQQLPASTQKFPSRCLASFSHAAYYNPVRLPFTTVTMSKMKCAKFHHNASCTWAMESWSGSSRNV